jgi:hypothetical protein
MRKFILILPILVFSFSSFSNNETCFDMGCLCGSETAIPNSCYNEPRRCCPGEAPQPPEGEAALSPEILQQLESILNQADEAQREAIARQIVKPEQNLCSDLGCFCSDADAGGLIPVACYSDSQRCCPGEAPEHIRKHFAEIRLGRGIESLASDLNQMTQCYKSDSDDSVAQCEGEDGIYVKAEAGDPNSLSQRLERAVVSSDRSIVSGNNRNPASSGSPQESAAGSGAQGE